MCCRYGTIWGWQNHIFNIASGLEKPTSGEVILKDISISNLKEPKLTKFRVKHIGYIFQQYNLVTYLTVKENIILTQQLTRQKIDKNKFQQLIKLVGLEGKEKIKVSKLSGGQQQRVAIARALIGNNEIVFADEPTGALDINTRNTVIQLLKDSCSQFNKSLFVVSHDPVVASYADLIIFIVDGKVYEILSTSDWQTITAKLVEIENNV
nr:ABC transporter ATP-binding protein [Spiroplasma sp. AdecLV25b]